MSRIEFKKTGFISLVFLTSACSSQFPLPCSYVLNELEPHAGCAVREGAELKISEDHLKRLHFDADSLAQILIDGQWFYVKPDGRQLPVVTYDNGADYFAEGLVRSSVGARIAYFDLNFAAVVPPKYDWGWPFENGLALVCNGCRRGSADADGHVPMEGGVWGYIDRRGQEVVPVTHSRERLRTP